MTCSCWDIRVYDSSTCDLQLSGTCMTIQPLIIQQGKLVSKEVTELDHSRCRSLELKFEPSSLGLLTLVECSFNHI